jgi:hypothetical protein
MRNRSLLVLIAVMFTMFGFRACYLKDYETELRYPDERSKIFISPDSITIAPFFYAEDLMTLVAVINFENVRDSIQLEDLNVVVYSPDNPRQVFQLKNVSTIVHPVTPTDGTPDKLNVHEFKDLSTWYKTIRNSGSPYNKIMFYFRTLDIGRTDFYDFKVNGLLIYKGQKFYFEKKVQNERKVEYHPYRMMT